MHRLRDCVPVVCLLAAAAAPALAQETGRRVYDEQLRVLLDQQAPDAREMGFDAGGWFNFAFFNFDDAAARKERTLRQYELRLWGKMNLQGVHRAYVRGMMGWDDWNSGTNPDGDGDEFNHPKVERAWYQFDLARWQKLQTGKPPPVGFRTRVGRDYVDLGTGLVLAMPLDMVRFDVTAGNWELTALLGRTIEHSRNIDDSAAVADHQDRGMWGAQLRYNGFDRHRPFVYFLDNHDRTEPDFPSPTQKYQYNSRYVGAGSEGTVILPDLRYQTEVIGELGETYSDGATRGKDHISAMAIDALLEYLFRVDTHPKITAEYLFGSGDKDRTLSATSTVGGNRVGTSDHAFNAFGFRDTGLAFAPRVSNLHIYSLGAAFWPLEKTELFKKLEVGTKAFLYQKAVSGAISDTTADRDSHWVGWEWDVYCDWRITSDLMWTVRYGAFRPGGAYDDQETRHFLYTAMTFSF
jgi:hypothetical protein